MHLHRDRKVLRSGESRTYLSVVHSVWEVGSAKGKRAKPVVFARLGAEEQLDQGVVRGIKGVLDKLLEQLVERDGGMSPGGSPVAPVLAAARVVRKQEAALRMVASREFGVRRVVEAVWERLGLDRVLGEFAAQHALSFDFERVVFGMVLNRLVDPMSKRACNVWLQERAYFPEADGWGVHVFYRALDLLDTHAEPLSEALLAAVRRRMPAEELRMLLLDTTSSFFATEWSDAERAEVEAEWEAFDRGEGARPEQPRPQVVNDPPMRMRGHSKDHRPDRPQVVIGVVAGAGGRLLGHRVYPGNRQDQRITMDLLADARKLAPGGRPVAVMDSGMSGEPNLARIDAMEPRVDRISAVPLRSLKKAEEVLSRAGRWAKHPTKAHVTLRVVELESSASSGRPERFIATRNRRSADRSNRVLDRNVAMIRAQLAKDDGVDDHGAPTCRMLSKPALKRLLRVSADGKRLLLDSDAVKRERRLAGVRLLRTTLMDLEASDVVAAYQGLLDLEDDFKTFKGPLRLRPMHHRADRRIKAHVLVCVLALAVLQETERLTGTAFTEVLNLVQGVAAARMTQGTREFWMRGEWSEEAQKMLRKLGVRPGRQTWPVQPTPARSKTDDSAEAE